MKKICILLLGLLLTSCASVGTHTRGSFETETDPFTGLERIKTKELCSVVSYGFPIYETYCFQFNVADNGARLRIEFHGHDWGFYNDVRVKILGSDGYIDLESYDDLREVLSGGYVKEWNYYRLDDEFYRFAKEAIDKELLVRLYGSKGYVDFELDTSKGDVWNNFIHYYEEHVASES